MTGTWHSAASAVQRPYDIHSSNAVETLVQLFSTMSVQYVPSWSKEMVALLRKVSPPALCRGGQHLVPTHESAPSPSGGPLSCSRPGCES